MKKYPIILCALTSLMVSCNEKVETSSEASLESSTISESEVFDTQEISIDLNKYNVATYSNPVSMQRSDSTPFKTEFADPTVIKGDDGKIYAFATDRATAVSEDGCNFTTLDYEIISFATWGEEAHGSKTSKEYMWAPDVIKIGDNWIYYYSLATSDYSIGIGYGIASTAAGPYTDMGKLFSSDEIGIYNSIDSQVIVDDDGVHMVLGSFRGCYVIDLTSDGMGLLGGVAKQNAEKVLVSGKPGAADTSAFEGSYITKKGDYYYYFGSAGSCCSGKASTYRVYCGRSKSIKGPYVGKDGVALTNCGSGKTYGELVLWCPTSVSEDMVAPGHNSIFIDDAGQYWIYYHAFSYHDHFNTRHLFMDRIYWDEDGYPYCLNKRPSLDEELDGPALLKNVA